jgi:tRNA G18 (ribose-2'-O)-methylase SpoU
MVGRTDSLNLAVAASVLLYEVFGQRHPVRSRIQADRRPQP